MGWSMNKKGMKAIEYIAVMILGLILLTLIIAFSSSHVRELIFEALRHIKLVILRS